MGGAIPGLVVLSSIREQAEQARGSKPLRRGNRRHICQLKGSRGHSEDDDGSLPSGHHSLASSLNLPHPSLIEKMPYS